MSSNNSNAHPDYDPNIRIKSEPGTGSETSTTSTSTTNSETLNPNKTIKTEPGLAAPPSTRLTSFRVPRDLTLGGHVKSERPKKVYVPNLNVQRKSREEQNAVKTETTAKTNRGRGRDRGRGSERGRGRGKLNNIIQSTGIFSEGLADTSTRRSGSGIYRERGEGSSSGRETSANLERPKLSIPHKVNKVEEDEKLRELLRDDFIDNGDDGAEDNVPVTLPMINGYKLSKIEASESIPAVNHEKPILQNGEANAHKAGTISAEAVVKDTKLLETVPQVMEDKSNSFILVQLPDCLPGLVSDESPNDSKPVAGTSKDATNNQSSQFCTLDNLKEGMLGKLQILKSGKARLVFGDNNLIVDVGSNISFRQDLIAAKISDDKQSGDLVNLGPVNSTLICSPDWETMLQNL